MPDIRNCRKCGKMYNYIGGNPVCPVCKEKDEEDFKQVKEYLYKNHGASLYEVSTVLEISVERIKGYLREGRLEILNNEGNLVLECEKCGKSIKSGRFCDGCTNNLTKDLKSASVQESNITPDESEKTARAKGMRYLHKDR